MPSEKLTLQNGNGDVQSVCPRCKSECTLLQLRGEHLCQVCFLNYTQSKIAKKMESFRVRNSNFTQPRKLLLPLSFGTSSLSLLHALDNLLDRQKSRTRRVGFELDVLVILDSEIVEAAVETSLDAVKERYPSHKYHVKQMGEVDGLVNRKTQCIGDDQNGGLENGLSAHDVPRSNHFSTAISATHRADARELHRTNRTVEEAQALGCEGILWGHTTTRLAERILAETAKGRGFALPWLARDGSHPSGVTFSYPMKDMLKKEIISYTKYCDPPLYSLAAADRLDRQTPAASKNSTIDDLMKDYFTTVEQSYPSIVANVVRTSNKLVPGRSDENCNICKLPLPTNLPEKSDKPETQDFPIPLRTSERSLCTGCAALAS